MGVKILSRGLMYRLSRMIATLLHSTYSFMNLSCASAAILLFGPLKVNSHAESRVHRSVLNIFFSRHLLRSIESLSHIRIIFTVFNFNTNFVPLCFAYTADIDLPVLTPAIDFNSDFQKG